MARIVVLGASGYTGRLTVEALLRRGQDPVLAGRSAAKLERLAAELGGEPAWRVADVSQPGAVESLLAEGDVIVSTVGPFMQLGDAAATAAVRGRAHYLDSNGEPQFTRRVFERFGAEAAAAGIGMLVAFGWECALGNLAGALALREAGEPAVRVDTGYFYTGATGFSDGTRASFADAMLRPSFAYRAGAIRTVRGAERYRTFAIGGSERPGVSLGASEHFALPRSFPQLCEVNAYQGWFGRLSPRIARPLHAASGVGFALLRHRGARALWTAASDRFLQGAGDGPTAAERSRSGVHVVAIAYDASGGELAQVHLRGVEGYEFTAAILAWGAARAAAAGLERSGALGPVEAFGIDDLEAGCREAGVFRLEPDPAPERRRSLVAKSAS